MKILQSKEKKWFLNKCRIVSESSNLKDVLYCQEKLLYSTMRSYFLVMESYEETFSYFMGCYGAMIRFYENFMEPTRYAWINKDAGTPFFEEHFGKNQYFLGEIDQHLYKPVKDEIKELNGRCVVIERDWYIRFRDHLIYTCY